jgi:hypothetical protein
MIAKVRRRAISGGKAGRFVGVSNMFTAIDWGRLRRKTAAKPCFCGRRV